MRILLAVITVIYLMLISFQDLKERKIYTFPCVVLSFLWGMDIIMQGELPLNLFFGYLAVSTCLYIVFTVKKIWGAGDSDLFFLFTVVYLAFVGEAYTMTAICNEIILFAFALISSLFIAVIEAKTKKTSLKKNSSIAVAPGFAVIMFGLIVKGVLKC